MERKEDISLMLRKE